MADSTRGGLFLPIFSFDLLFFMVANFWVFAVYSSILVALFPLDCFLSKTFLKFWENVYNIPSHGQPRQTYVNVYLNHMTYPLPKPCNVWVEVRHWPFIFALKEFHCFEQMWENSTWYHLSICGSNFLNRFAFSHRKFVNPWEKKKNWVIPLFVIGAILYLSH